MIKKNSTLCRRLQSSVEDQGYCRIQTFVAVFHCAFKEHRNTVLFINLNHLDPLKKLLQSDTVLRPYNYACHMTAKYFESERQIFFVV